MVSGLRSGCPVTETCAPGTAAPDGRGAQGAAPGPLPRRPGPRLPWGAERQGRRARHPEQAPVLGAGPGPGIQAPGRGRRGLGLGFSGALPASAAGRWGRRELRVRCGCGSGGRREGREVLTEMFGHRGLRVTPAVPLPGEPGFGNGHRSGKGRRYLQGVGALRLFSGSFKFRQMSAASGLRHRLWRERRILTAKERGSRGG